MSIENSIPENNKDLKLVDAANTLKTREQNHPLSIETNKEGIPQITVRSGDTLWGIATNKDVKQSFEMAGFKGLSTDERIDYLIKLNSKDMSGGDPTVLRPGEIIRLPTNPFNILTKSTSNQPNPFDVLKR